MGPSTLRVACSKNEVSTPLLGDDFFVIPDLIGNRNIIRLHMYRMAMLYVFLKKFLTL